MIIEKELSFILTMDQLKNVERRNFNLDDSRRENTAEHSWQVVILAQVLYPYAKNKEQIDLLRVLKMLSIHDIVEIKAGDTFIFDEKKMVGKYQRELKAAEELFGMLPDELGKEFLNLWIEFEKEETHDAVFAAAVDRIMPFILNVHNKGVSWTEANITSEMVDSIVGKAVVRASDAFREAYDLLKLRAISEGKLL